MAFVSLLLDRTVWDLCKDSSFNIAVASEPYRIAQDVACAIKTFQGEVYYDTQRGIAYWAQILGLDPPLALLKTSFVNAAMTVPGVVAAVCYIDAITNRQVTGQVLVTDVDGGITPVGF